MQREEHKEHLIFISGLPGGTIVDELIDFLNQTHLQNQTLLSPVKLTCRKFRQGLAVLTTQDFAIYSTIVRERRYLFKDRYIYVSSYLSPNKLKKKQNNLKLRRIFVTSPHLIELDLFDLFSRYGEVEDAYVIRDSIDHKPLKYGYVLFRHASSAQLALSAQTIIVGSTFIRACPFKAKEEKKTKVGTIEDILFLYKNDPEVQQVDYHPMVKIEREWFEKPTKRNYYLFRSKKNFNLIHNPINLKLNKQDKILSVIRENTRKRKHQHPVLD